MKYIGLVARSFSLIASVAIFGYAVFGVLYICAIGIFSGDPADRFWGFVLLFASSLCASWLISDLSREHDSSPAQQLEKE